MRRRDARRTRAGTILTILVAALCLYPASSAGGGGLGGLSTWLGQELCGCAACDAPTVSTELAPSCCSRAMPAGTAEQVGDDVETCPCTHAPAPEGDGHPAALARGADRDGLRSAVERVQRDADLSAATPLPTQTPSTPGRVPVAALDAGRGGADLPPPGAGAASWRLLNEGAPGLLPALGVARL